MKAEYDFSKAKRGAVIPPTGKGRITIPMNDYIQVAFRKRAKIQGKK